MSNIDLNDWEKMIWASVYATSFANAETPRGQYEQWDGGMRAIATNAAYDATSSINYLRRISGPEGDKIEPECLAIIKAVVGANS